jgi:hypothetical protein
VPLRDEPIHGELNGLHVMRFLDQLRYQGWVGLEYRPQAEKTKAGLEPWFQQLQCRRHGSAGILFTCMGKQGKPYILLGQVSQTLHVCLRTLISGLAVSSVHSLFLFQLFFFLPLGP